MDQVFTFFNKVIGIERLKVIHANDARGELGSNLDRHEHIGKGILGETGFRAIINHPLIVKYDIPFILETPENDEGDFIINLAKMRELAL